MATVTTLAGKAASLPDGGKAAQVKPDAGTAFAAMIAGATDHSPRVDETAVKGAVDKPQRTRRADSTSAEDGTSATTAASTDASTPAVVPLAVPAPPVTDPTRGKNGEAVPSDVRRAASAATALPSQDGESSVDLTQSAVDIGDAKLAPVLAALADSLAAKQASDRPTLPAIAGPPSTAPTVPAAPIISAPAPLPTTATAALMASRIAPAGVPFSGRADARAPAVSNRKSADDADPDAPSAGTDPSVSLTPGATAAATSLPAANARHAPAPAADRAAGQLAAGAADRQLDLARQGAWLDGLSHDIAATGTGAGPLRFAVAPQHLGTVQVELARGGDGATVTLTASSEAGRVALADARPQLVAEARAQGIHIASAQVDVGGGQAGSQSRSSSGHASGQGDSRSSPHAPSGQGGFSGQGGGRGESRPRSQTRSQPLAANPVSQTGSTGADTAPTRPADGLYA